MTIAAASKPDRAEDERAAKGRERRVLGVACGAHLLHDGYTDLIWVALPIWQAEFGLTYAAVGLLRMIYSGTMASLQMPASALAERAGPGLILALGTVLSGLCYCLAGIGSGFAWLLAALFIGGLGAATQHPIASALVARTFTGARALTIFGTYNFAGDVGKVVLPATASLALLLAPWRPAYGLLGVIGIVAALVIFLLTPRFVRAAAAPKDASRGSGVPAAGQPRSGFGILMAFGVADSVVRGAFFVLLPFLLIAKGATVVTAGLALTLLFAGGAAGKLACGFIARSIGMAATIVMAQALTAAGMLAVLVLPLAPALVLLPLLGIALNGVTTVIYGSVPGYVAPEKRARALSLFYTVTIGSAALAPPLSGFVGDLIGIKGAAIAVSVLTLATIPVAFPLRAGRGEDA